MLALPACVVLMALAADTTNVLDAGEVWIHLFALVFFAPLFTAALVLLAGTHIGVDGERAELVVTRRVLGIPWARTRIPLEIVSGFSTRAVPGLRGSTEELVVQIAAAPSEIVLYRGYGTRATADTLNGSLMGASSASGS
jgi:hypothetical protein